MADLVSGPTARALLLFTGFPGKMRISAGGMEEGRALQKEEMSCAKALRLGSKGHVWERMGFQVCWNLSEDGLQSQSAAALGCHGTLQISSSWFLKASGGF